MARVLCVMLAAGGLLFGCAHAPKTAEERSARVDQADQALNKMVSNDPSLRRLLDESAGYIVIPRVVEAGFIAAGGAGKGVLYEGGRPIGYVQLSKGSLGLTVGGHTFAELIIARDQNALAAIKSGDFKFSGETAAVAVTSGVAGSTMFKNGVAVFVQPEAGGMLNLSLAGQSIKVKM
jgi:lipid-binding SYLF domain-containing protein